MESAANDQMRSRCGLGRHESGDLGRQVLTVGIALDNCLVTALHGIPESAAQGSADTEIDGETHHLCAGGRRNSARRILGSVVNHEDIEPESSETADDVPNRELLVPCRDDDEQPPHEPSVCPTGDS